VLLGDEREQAGDGGGLAGAWTAGENGRPAADGRLGGDPLLGVVGIVEEPVETGGESRLVDVQRGVIQPRQDVITDGPLLAPIAVEVEP
jgi:hypothetical protein